MKQPKKIFTRMLINNWGGISHKMLEFHEYVNLFSGKSGSGKSTVMDAIQVVLYGSVSANFLNKAADDSKNKRSVLSYLRGAQKDGTANRGDVDFCSQIVLEIEDTATHIVTCVGAAFEVAKGDTDLKKYTYFSHSGRIPKDEYLENNVPYSIAQIRKLTEERSRSADNRGRGEVNKVYPSKEAYLYTLYGEIFGQVEQGRMITMEKSAIALKMTSGTGQFIRDYMFPKTKEDTVATISEQLGAYREIKERVEDLEKRIEMLDKIQVYDRELTNVRAEKVRTETVLKCIDIEENIIRLKGRESELESVEKEADGEYSLDEIAIIDDAMFKTIDLDEDTLVDWDELQTEHREEPDLVYCSECGRVIGRTVEYTDYDDNPICAECMVSNSAGDICPACGRKVPHEFMINGFCIDCSEENE